jgi:lipopolysaccharide/colanic/teichoic acid biosynthesis glycosyltransferase
VTVLRVNPASNLPDSPFEPLPDRERLALNERSFRQTIAIERKRTERSKEPFLLMLLETGNPQGAETNGRILERMASALLSAGRETDVVGWYKDRVTVGVLFTGLVVKDRNSILSTILSRVKTILRDQLRFDQVDQVSISFHFFPDDWDRGDSGSPSNTVLYPDLSSIEKRRKPLLLAKRIVDIAGSSLALILFLPLFVVIALAIKLSSKGPVLFRQTRVGQYGRHFTFLKFRSMYADNDHTIHKRYVTEFIARDAQGKPPKREHPGQYKLTDDKRITRVGRILRRTSMDELPQFFNVLQGDMSLVGPRPAIPYELAAYQTWHRRRILEAKPGITGLWQVTGRSHVRFDEMVRMDLRYAKAWSPWLDFKILLRTPLAVIRGTGAY